MSLLACALLCTLTATLTADLLDRGAKMMAQGNFERAAKYYKAAIIRDVTEDAAWDGYRRAVLALDEQVPATEAALPATVSVVAAPQTLVSIEEVPDALEPLPEPTNTTEAAPEPRQFVLKRALNQNTQARRGIDSSIYTVFDAVDATLLDSMPRARRRFSEEKRKRSRLKKRDFGGIVQVKAIYFSPNLYKYESVALAAEKGWDFSETQMNYIVASKHTKDNYEFRVELENKSFPRKYIFIKDVAKRSYILDDKGNKYSPARSKGPREKTLKTVDSYTVYFPKTTKDGKPLFEKCRNKFWLVIYALDAPDHVLKLRFMKHVLDL